MTQAEYDKLHAMVKQFQRMLVVESLDIEVETFIRSQVRTVEQLLDAYDEAQQEVAA